MRTQESPPSSGFGGDEFVDCVYDWLDAGQRRAQKAIIRCTIGVSAVTSRAVMRRSVANFAISHSSSALAGVHGASGSVLTMTRPHLPINHSDPYHTDDCESQDRVLPNVLPPHREIAIKDHFVRVR